MSEKVQLCFWVIFIVFIFSNIQFYVLYYITLSTQEFSQVFKYILIFHVFFHSFFFSTHSRIMHQRWLILIGVCLVSTVEIRQISNGIYISQLNDTNSSYSFQFSMNCDECLCHAFSSNNNYAVINCIKNTRWCLFYTNLSTNYTFILNINASAYILSPILSITTSSAPPPPPTTTTTTTSTKTTTTTSVSTSTSM